MQGGFRRWWPLIKAVVLVLVMIGVGWHLVRLLHNEELARSDSSRSPGRILWDEAVAVPPGLLVLCGLLYLGAFCCSGGYWVWLVRREGDVLPALPGLRAYFLSQLGKYVPGKGVALVMRTALSAEAGCRPAAAVLTAVYETLTTMAAGAMVAAVLLLLQGGEKGMLWQAAALVILAGVPILPGVFNRVVERVTARFRKVGAPELPRPSGRSLLVGLALTAGGWFLMGASLEALLLGLGAVEGPTLHGWFLATTYVAVSYVAGFIASTPGGLGVREFLLVQMLTPKLGARAIVAALLLRLLWTVAELAMAAVVWWFPTRAAAPSGEKDREV